MTNGKDVFRTELFDFQEDAVNKLRKLKVGALYMEMGTGKTRTALELLHIRLSKGRMDKCLWFCPCSVKYNLETDIKKHAPELLKYIKIMGIQSISQSNRIYLEALNYISTGEVFLIVDESSLVKNHKALRSQRMQAIASKCKYRLILNGTPVTRNHVDLFSQWYILDWRILGYMSYHSFARNHIEYDSFGRFRECLNVDYLTSKIAPYTFQITKDEVLDLPDKIYEEHNYELTEDQSWHYTAVADYMFSRVDEFDSTTIFRTLTALQLVASGRVMTNLSDEGLEHEPFFDDPMDNPRIQNLLYLASQTEKCIIWCKYHFEINDIRQALSKDYEEDEIYELHGKMSYKEKRNQIEDFKKQGRFLIANKATGSYGLNLQFCNEVIYYSNDFDYGTRSQSEDRVHRIGQEEKVLIYDIYSDSSIDKMIKRSIENKESMLDVFMEHVDEKKYIEVKKVEKHAPYWTTEQGQEKYRKTLRRRARY